MIIITGIGSELEVGKEAVKNGDGQGRVKMKRAEKRKGGYELGL